MLIAKMSLLLLFIGSCYDNSAAESFFGLLKRERVNHRKYTTRAEARTDIFDYIERFYNQRKQQFLNSNNIHQTTLKLNVRETRGGVINCSSLRV